MHQPDELDNRIMREIGSPRIVQWDIRESYASIAKRVGVDEETIRKRIKRMEREGLIMGWRVMINPSLIGRSYVAIDTAVREVGKKADVISRLKRIDGVVAFMDFEGSGMLIFIYSGRGDALGLDARRIAQVCGEEASVVEPLGIPPCELKLSVTDWGIIWSIRNDPRKNHSQIAEDVHVSTRTVNRRLEALTENGAFFLIGVPDLRKSFGVSANFLIQCMEGHSSSSIAEMVASRFDNVVFGGPFSSSLVSYNIVFDNLIKAREAADWIKGVGGVAKVRLGIMEDMVFVADWLDDQIAKHLGG